MSIGSNIKIFREEHKLTQEQVADKIGVTFQAVTNTLKAIDFAVEAHAGQKRKNPMSHIFIIR